MVPRKEEQIYLLSNKDLSITYDDDKDTATASSALQSFYKKNRLMTISLILLLLLGLLLIIDYKEDVFVGTGPYKLRECQEGDDFWDAYEFYNGEDSLGSAGYNIYVGKNEAVDLGLVSSVIRNKSSPLIRMESSVNPLNTSAPRRSVRLEGKKRYDSGLFLLSLKHMPTGCGVWPAFWLTDEPVWPKHGEIDILEGINTQSTAKTALHTREMCSMYSHIPDYAKTGSWDWATGIPDRWTGVPDFETKKEADDCWASSAHQWYNQGCVAVSESNSSLGKSMNDNDGGVYALEWDPANGYIKSWVFRREGFPSNLKDAMATASDKKRIIPDPNTWGLPYAYFAIGPETGCSADHFHNMRIVFNLAFCGAVAGNRFAKDCPTLAKQYDQNGDSWQACNAYLRSNPKQLKEEAYW
eukprot:CAMPEP_0194184706 /NCGR_PEP_ID=MMETSP0154-20130528/39225_1 /TAXON_ID=1049557 /ORGANISM="Thalassiothrix antarctica, Strain L6-D1" /LENGTH=411 /DNA_ID=CAMNT_0038902535 /DNA_START=75 /DNA_END=1307 /DNA_ORIENTATION=-